MENLNLVADFESVWRILIACEILWLKFCSKNKLGYCCSTGLLTVEQRPSWAAISAGVNQELLNSCYPPEGVCCNHDTIHAPRRSMYSQAVREVSWTMRSEHHQYKCICIYNHMKIDHKYENYGSVRFGDAPLIRIGETKEMVIL